VDIAPRHPVKTIMLRATLIHHRLLLLLRMAETTNNAGKT